MKVLIYWNIHKQLWSVRDQLTRKVIAHLESLVLTNCTFKVSEKGRQRVLREQQKNVHAGIEGDLALYTPNTKCRLGRRVKYNPYTQSTFTCEDQPINTATVVRFYPDRSVHALGMNT